MLMRLFIVIVLTFLLGCVGSGSAMAIQLDFVPYMQGTVWSSSDSRPNWNFGTKFEAKDLCFLGKNIVCKYAELYVGYDVARFTAENGTAIACTDPLGCTSTSDGTIPSMTKKYEDAHWDQTVFGGIQFRFNLLGK